MYVEGQRVRLKGEPPDDDRQTLDPQHQGTIFEAVWMRPGWWWVHFDNRDEAQSMRASDIEPVKE